MPEETSISTRTQRLGAYAVAFSQIDGVDSMLLTRISPTGYPPGWWTLAGGGVDHGESPYAAVQRELYEEAGLRARAVRMVDVHDIHTVDRSRDDGYEDYHGVHLLFAVDVDASQQPTVIEVGGSTDVAQWVPVAEIGTTYAPVLPMVQYAIERRELFDWS